MQDYQNRLARFKDTDAEKNQLISVSYGIHSGYCCVTS